MSNRLDMIAALDAKQQVVYREARESGHGITSSLLLAHMSSRARDLPGHERGPDYQTRASRGDFHEPNGDLK